MRCPDCSKFVSLEFEEPEVENDLECDDDGNVTGTLHIVRTCAECGTELKEATIDLEADISGELPEKPEVKEGETAPDYEITIETGDVSSIEEGGGRYQKSYFGGEVTFTVTCSWNEEWSYEGSVSGKVAASEMEEMG